VLVPLVNSVVPSQRKPYFPYQSVPSLIAFVDCSWPFFSKECGQNVLATNAYVPFAQIIWLFNGKPILSFRFYPSGLVSKDVNIPFYASVNRE
jgi:hypothetical protein